MLDKPQLRVPHISILRCGHRASARPLRPKPPLLESSHEGLPGAPPFCSFIAIGWGIRAPREPLHNSDASTKANRYNQRVTTLYIATSNPGKLRDFAAAAAVANPNSITIEPLPNLKQIPAPPEDEPTFAANARLKAIYYSRHAPGQIVIADDSGLEVDALHGAPGVRSARYAEDMNFPTPSNLSTDARNNLYLLHALSKIPAPYPARYHCVLAAARDGEILSTADGTVEGEILLTPRGTEGFGYDPLFFLSTQNKTMAELDIATKLTFSHRSRALAALLRQLPL
jgi:XTP/dITP diphosphohydrolase